MSPIGDNQYGDEIADIYDDLFDDRDDLDVVCSTLLDLAAGGRILEFGVGTGRIAVPLARRGAEVVGIDNSPLMLEKMAAKPDGTKVLGVLGDCCETRTEGSFSLVFSAFSTIFLIGTQDDQVRSFENAAAHLVPGGCFVVEAFVHDRSKWASGSEATTVSVGESSAYLRLGTHDAVAQIIRTQHLSFTPDGTTFRPNRLRYIWPTELDLMARIAGLRRESWWSGWDRSPLAASSGNLIAVYRRV